MDKELQLISLPAGEAHELHVLASNGDKDAVAAFAELWPEVGECFLCGAELKPKEDELLELIPDPEGG